MGDSTASDRVLDGTGSVVSQFGVSQPDIHLAAGEDETCQETDMGFKDFKSTTEGFLVGVVANAGDSQDIISKAGKDETYHTTGCSTASVAVLGCDRMDRSTTTVGLACARSGFIIIGDSRGEAQRASMESLPSDVVQEILSWVPAELVLECKLVCKKWVTLIRGRNFANLHLTHQLKHLHDGDDGDDSLAAKVEPNLFLACEIDDPDKVTTLLFHGGQVSDRISNDKKYIYSQNLRRIYHPRMHNKPLFYHFVGSCNGLVCAYQHHHKVLDPIYICNPLTREYVYLPQLVIKEEDLDPRRFCVEFGGANMYHHITCGFGYVRSTNEYKVVRIHYLEYTQGVVEVYTIGSGCGWRSVGIIPYRLITSKKSAYVNDAIYWTSGNKVAAFDLAKEEFRLLPVPPCMQNLQQGDRYGLVALGRHLCLYMDNKLNVEIWSLMNSSDLKETWRMEFHIDYKAVVGSRERNFHPILLTKKGEIIFLHAESVLYCYDTKTTSLKMISDEACTDYFYNVEVIAHVNTFASLESMGENSKRYTVRPRRVRTPWDDVIDELDRVALGEEIDTTRFRLG